MESREDPIKSIDAITGVMPQDLDPTNGTESSVTISTDMEQTRCLVGWHLDSRLAGR